MYDELTEIDIQKMREEIDHRVRVLRPKLIEDVQAARAFGEQKEQALHRLRDPADDPDLPGVRRHQSGPGLPRL